MGHCADHLPGRIARQLCVGVQGDYIMHRENVPVAPKLLWRVQGVAVYQHEVFGAFMPQQQRVEFRQFPALAFPAHPHALFWVVHPGPVAEKEIIHGAAGIFTVKMLNGLMRLVEQALVAGHAFRGGVFEIGKQAELDVFVAVGQKMHFQAVGQFFNVAFTSQHGGHYHQSAHFGRNAFCVVHAGHEVGRNKRGGKPVHQFYAKLAGHDRYRNQGQRQPEFVPAVFFENFEKGPGKQGGEGQGQAKIQEQGTCVF